MSLSRRTVSLKWHDYRVFEICNFLAFFSIFNYGILDTKREADAKTLDVYIMTDYKNRRLSCYVKSKSHSCMAQLTVEYNADQSINVYQCTLAVA